MEILINQICFKIYYKITLFTFFQYHLSYLVEALWMEAIIFAYSGNSPFSFFYLYDSSINFLWAFACFLFSKNLASSTAQNSSYSFSSLSLHSTACFAIYLNFLNFLSTISYTSDLWVRSIFHLRTLLIVS